MEDKVKNTQAEIQNIASKQLDSQKTAAAKKIYQSPKLTHFGSIKELTKFGGSMTADFFAMQT